VVSDFLAFGSSMSNHFSEKDYQNYLDILKAEINADWDGINSCIWV
jgi:hypothetical protein